MQSNTKNIIFLICIFIFYVKYIRIYITTKKIVKKKLLKKNLGIINAQ